MPVLRDLARLFKKCPKCGEEKSSSLFSKNKNRKDGLDWYCKSCKSEKDAARYKPEKRKEKYEKEVEAERQKRRDYYGRNKEKYFVSKAKRRASLLSATPNWYSDLDSFILSEMYDLCKRREKSLGIPFEVDHVVPLQGENVCGLHWHKNWQLLPKTLNRSKGNKLCK